MNKIIFLVMLLAACVNNVHAETYQQCKKRVEADIARYEAQTGQLVTDENKRLSVQTYCSGK